MSSYYPSFTYMGQNSLKDKNLMVIHFESGDSGEMDTFLGMEQVYTDNPYGTKRLTYGAKYNNVAVIRISVMKTNGTDFTVTEVRDFLKWTTGARRSSYLDLVDGDEVKASFLGHITAVYQQKMDARTVGFTIEHTSVSPYAYSPLQSVSCAFGQALTYDDSIVSHDIQDLIVDNNGILNNGTNAMFNISGDGILFIDKEVQLQLNNPTDDIYSCVDVETEIQNFSGDWVTIKNITLNETTQIDNLVANENVTLTSGQFIISDKPNKIFGNTFNFIWPRLAPGINNMLISGSGEGVVIFTYRYPIKIGDCAIDVYVPGSGIDCGNCPDSAYYVSWDDIIDIPSTIGGYGITDAYTRNEIDNKLARVNVSVNESELNAILNNILK